MLKGARLHASRSGLFWLNLCYACAETAICQPPVKLLTLSLDSATPISYMARLFWRSVDIHHVTLTFNPLTLNVFICCALTGNNFHQVWTQVFLSVQSWFSHFRYLGIPQYASTSHSLYVVVRPSVVCLSVSNVREPYSGDWNFRLYFHIIRKIIYPSFL